jgi:hypothetical protein
MEKAIDGKIYPEMKIVFRRNDDETTIMTVDIADVPIGYTVILNTFMHALFTGIKTE